MEGAAEVVIAEPLESPAAHVGEGGGDSAPHSGRGGGSVDADKAARRKDANRASAKKSRERKAQTLEQVKTENETLKARVAQLEAQLAVAEGRPPPAPPAPAADALLPFTEGAGDTDAALPIKKQKR